MTVDDHHESALTFPAQHGRSITHPHWSTAVTNTEKRIGGVKNHSSERNSGPELEAGQHAPSDILNLKAKKKPSGVPLVNSRPT